ncbi:type II toxin-antitoxin system RelE/ParE family toxin [bacterium]|nr:type II toxin-antitoxin system RelE/ParE family toxin [bacterium]
MEPRKENIYRIRIGDYRVIFSKDDGNKIIIIHRI